MVLKTVSTLGATGGGGGGGGSPGGSTTQVQYNNGGAFAGDGNLTFSGSTLTSANLIVSNLTASQAVFSSSTKQLVSNPITGTGSVVMNSSPILTSPSLITPVLGTPSSGTVTNLTGTASININGTVGATTASTGAFTTLSASSTVSGTGFSTYLASPPAIGGTAAAAGSFTTLTASTSITQSGVAVPTISSTSTFTNKRITARISSTTNITSPLVWNSDNFDQYAATAQANALTINADSGTPTDGQKMIFRFKDNGTARALTWTTGTSKSFRAVGVTLPTTTVASKTVYVGCVYNNDAVRWDAIAVSQEA